MHTRTFAGLLVVGTITAAPVIALAWLLVVATVNFHDALHVTVFLAVMTHLHLARRDRRADHRAAQQTARSAWMHRTTGPVEWPPAEDKERVEEGLPWHWPAAA
jgi:hypothetical protein